VTLEYLNFLGLDDNAVRSHALAYAGYGMACRRVASRSSEMSPTSFQPPDFARGDKSEQRFWYHTMAGSSFVIAGAHFALLDPAVAELLFWAAMTEYARTSNPYASVLALCADERHGLSAAWRGMAEQYEYEAHRHSAAPLVLVAASLAADDGEQFVEVIQKTLSLTEASSGARTGRLGLPIRLYRALLEEITETSDVPQTKLPESLVSLFQRAGEQIDSARTDVFHWSHFLSGVLPVEPELLAAGLVFVRYRSRPNQRVRRRDTGLKPRSFERMFFDLCLSFASLPTSRREHADVPAPYKDTLIAELASERSRS
jgi:hypothetical protein